MIKLNSIYFDRIRTVKVVSRREITGWCADEFGVWPTGHRRYFDVEVNGEKLGLELDKVGAEKWIKGNII